MQSDILKSLLDLYDELVEWCLELVLKLQVVTETETRINLLIQFMDTQNNK